MSSQEIAFSIKPPLFNGTKFIVWKVIMKTFLQGLGAYVWEIVEGGY